MTPQAATHLLRALELYRRALRVDGAPFPAELRDFELALVRTAAGRSGQERTFLAAEPGTPDDPPVPALLSVLEAASILRVDERTVRRYVAAGELPVVKLGTAVRVRPEDLRAFVARRTTKGSAA